MTGSLIRFTWLRVMTFLIYSNAGSPRLVTSERLSEMNVLLVISRFYLEWITQEAWLCRPFIWLLLAPQFVPKASECINDRPPK